MSAIQQLLTEHIEIWTAAEIEKKSGRGRASGNAASVYGFKKLRELILELAVRGKLVPQDASEEPASELLKRIHVAKEQLVNAGNTKKNKTLNVLTDDEKPFSLPSRWVWTRFGDIVNIYTGKLDANAAVDTGEYPFFTCSQTPSKINSYSFDTSAVLLAGNGDFNVKYYQGKFDAYQRTYVIEPINFSLKFCFLLVLAQIKTITKNNRGSAIPYLKLGDLTTPVFALPSLHEQHRIVAKVDELMALCDQLETGHSDAIEAHETLVSHLLATLTGSQDSADFSAGWQRIAAHFDTLFTTEASIDALKQTLLQLAVMGKLVPQDPSDEPASALLERIEAEKARLIFEGKIRKDKPLSVITDAEKPFDLPQGWEWARLDQLSHVGTGATPLRTKLEYFDPPAINWVTSGETSNSHIFQTEQYVSPLAIEETNLTIYPSGTLIVAMYGQGKTRGQISELMIDACTNQACAAIELFNLEIHHRKYVKLFFVKIYDEIRELAAGGAQPNLNLSKIKETLLPLPPIIEQARIVAKVDELMALCDRIKERIADGGALQRKLADVMVAQAVA